MRIDKSAKPSEFSIFWNAITGKFGKAKSNAVKRFGVTDQCFAKDYKIFFETSNFIKYSGCGLVLEGDKDEMKKYCIKGERKTDGVHISVAEGECP